jgi:hypothetical protein
LVIGTCLEFNEREQIRFLVPARTNGTLVEFFRRELAVVLFVPARALNSFLSREWLFVEHLLRGRRRLVPLAGLEPARP